MKQKHFIDTHKAATGPFVLALIAIYGQWQNPTAWVYLALHGTYGVLWALKSRIFPDKNWEQSTGWRYGLVIWGGLTLYWIAPWLLTSRSTQAPPWYLGMCISLYSLGLFLNFGTDMQKFIELKSQPEHLIVDGMMKFSRNLNYFGELLIYLGFGLLAMHWLPILVLGLFMVIVWIPNMRKKDRSLSRYSDFPEYRQQSRFFIPFII